jgi:hypothetical protein
MQKVALLSGPFTVLTEKLCFFLQTIQGAQKCVGMEKKVLLIEFKVTRHGKEKLKKKYISQIKK